METRTGKRYATDLTDRQWAEIKQFLDPPRAPSRGGRPRRYPRRWFADAVLYQLRTGVQWRLLPGDLPIWTAVWRQFCRWRDSGVWRVVMERLLRRCREEAGRDPHLLLPSEVHRRGCERAAPRPRQGDERDLHACHPATAELDVAGAVAVVGRDVTAADLGQDLLVGSMPRRLSRSSAQKRGSVGPAPRSADQH